MYPKVRPDLYVIAAEGGVRVMLDGQSHTLKGASVLPLLERLLPLLNGHRSVEELCAGLDAARAQAVTALILTLHRLGVVRDHAANQGVRLGASALTRYAGPLAYLETLTEGAERRFAALRERSVTVIGHGSAVRTLAPALWESGVRRGCVVADAASLPMLQEALDSHNQQDADLRWELRLLPPGRWSDTERERARRADLVIAVGDPEEVRTLFTEVSSPQQAVLPVQLGGAQDLIGPLSRPGQPVCLLCAQARIDRTSPAVDTAVHALTGARGAIEAFKHLAGLPSLAAGTVIRIDGGELTDTLHPVLPDGGCPRCAGTAAPSFSELRPGLVDPLTGLLRHLGPHDLMQLPVCLWVAHSPDGRRHVGAGRTAAAARVSAALGALRAGLRVDGGRAAPVIGRTHDEWLGLGVLDLARRETRPDESVSGEQLAALLDREAALWWKTLQVRDGRRFTAWLGRHPASGVPVVELRGEQGGERSAGRTTAEALKTALLSAVARAQLAAEPDLGGLTLADAPALPEPVADAPDWTAFLATLGPVRGQPLADATLQAAGLFAGQVELPSPQRLQVFADAVYT